MQKQIHIQWVLGTQKYVPRFKHECRRLFENEQSVTFEENETVSIQLHANDGEVIILKDSLGLQKKRF